MSAIRFYIEGNKEVYLSGDVEFDVKHGDIYITFKHEDMDAIIMGLEDLNVEVTYGSPDDGR